MAWAIPDDKRNCTFPIATSIPFKKYGRHKRLFRSGRYTLIDLTSPIL